MVEKWNGADLFGECRTLRTVVLLLFMEYAAAVIVMVQNESSFVMVVSDPSISIQLGCWSYSPYIKSYGRISILEVLAEANFVRNTYFCEHWWCLCYGKAHILKYNFVLYLLKKNSGQVGCSNSLLFLGYRLLADFVMSNFRSNNSCSFCFHHGFETPRVCRNFIDHPLEIAIDKASRCRSNLLDT